MAARPAQLDNHLDNPAVVTEWQMQVADGSAVPDSSDSRARVAAAVRESVPPAARQVRLERAALLVRLRRYDQRVEAALERLEAGDIHYLAHPRVDSYHTIWFELHEELIQLAGRTRAEESNAGRA